MRTRNVLISTFVCLVFAGASLRADEPIITPDVVYGHKDGMALTYDIVRPKENANGSGILFVVSGGWVSAWAPPEQIRFFFQPLLDRGFTIYCVRHGSSPRYVIPEIVTDVRKALSHIWEHASEIDVDRNRLGVFGFSAGGHLSLMLGTVGGEETKANGKELPRVRAVAAVFPPTDLNPYVEPSNPLREQFPALKFEPERANDFSPLMQVTSDDSPTLLVHGDRDELVPLWHSEKIHQAFEKNQVESRLVVISGAGHGFDAEGNKRMFDNMVEWFERFLLEKPNNLKSPSDD